MQQITPNPKRPFYGLLADFLIEARAGRVGSLLGIRDSHMTFTAHVPQIDHAAPSFDFGTFPGFENVPEEWKRLVSPLPILLPYDRCFLLHQAPDVDEPGLIGYSIAYLERVKGGCAVRNYLSTDRERIWMEQPFRFTIPLGVVLDDNVTMPVVFPAGNNMDATDRDEFSYRARNFFRVLAISLYVLNHPEVIRHQVPEPVPMPKRMLLTVPEKKRPRPTIILDLDRPLIQRRAEACMPTGKTVSPHDRRSHYRRLRDGRMVVVRSCKIKGGAPTGQLYEVEKHVL